MHMLTEITDNNSLNPPTYTAIRRLILSLLSLDRVFFSARAGIYLNTLFLTFKSYRLTLPECIRRISRVVLLFVSKAARGFEPFVLKCVLFDCMFVCVCVVCKTICTIVPLLALCTSWLARVNLQTKQTTQTTFYILLKCAAHTKLDNV